MKKMNYSEMTDKELEIAFIESKTMDEYYACKREMNKREKEKRAREEEERLANMPDVEVTEATLAFIDDLIEQNNHNFWRL